MADARKDRRTLLSLKIRYKSATLEDFIERYSTDISRGGVFIKANKPLAVGTLLKFEFMLQDQSTLLHGVGRVAWRREPEEATDGNPAGMGIKFIKMDPESRAVVQRIVDQSGLPGVFEHGKGGVQAARSDAPPSSGGDQTKVRHVSEFLASAFDEGGAGEAAQREAREGVARARLISDRVGAARGAFTTRGDAPASERRSASDAPSRGAMSAFGSSSAFASTGMRNSAAPALDDLDDEDFLDSETTKVQQLPTSEFPDPAATVISAEASPLGAERRRTPVVPPSTDTRSPLQDAVPDLFGPDSFGPAPGEFIDAALLDPGVATVPPKASAMPKGALPELGAIPAETFKVPHAPAPVGATPDARVKRSRVGMLLFALLLVIAGGAVAAWQLGLADDIIAATVSRVDSAIGRAAKTTPASATARVASTMPEQAEEDTLPSTEDTGAAEGDADPSAATAPSATEAGPAKATSPGLVRLQVVSVPNRAFVRVNGKGAGRTPLELEYAPGTKLSIYAKARGFLGRREELTAGASQSEIKLVLPPLPYVVEVETEPSGARASAIGGGEITTPGQLEFRSMPASRSIVIAKDGYVTVTKSMSRRSFVEEKNRMAASIKVTLAKYGAPAVAAQEPAIEPAAEETSAASPSEEAAPPDEAPVAVPEPSEPAGAADAP